MISGDAVKAGMAEIFADVFMRDDIAIGPDLSAKDVPDWDSFKQVEIIMATEERFAMRFTSMEVDGFRTLGDLMSVVARKATREA